MGEYPRTRRSVLFFMTLSLVVFMSCSASAQQGHSDVNRGRAVLHISVYVVHPVIAPQPYSDRDKSSVIVYNMPASSPWLEISEQTRASSLAAAGDSEKLDGALVKTITVVMK